MGTRIIGTVAALALVMTGAVSANLISSPAAHPAAAAGMGPQPQIPSLQVCNQTKTGGAALVKIASRMPPTFAGTFAVRLELSCDPAGTGYPAGSLAFTNISMNDSLVQGTIIATTFEQVTSTGQATPTLFVNGRCTVPPSTTTPNQPPINGCRYWLMIADNGQTSAAGVPATPEVVSFLVFNGLGQRVAYGSGPVVSGHIAIAPTPN
jgi:hypothetical protein